MHDVLESGAEEFGRDGASYAFSCSLRKIQLALVVQPFPMPLIYISDLCEQLI